MSIASKIRLWPRCSAASLQRAAIYACSALTLGASACTDDLGPCDMPAAQELVYGRAGLVATKGQALMHDSCGNAAFCHSSNAKSGARRGVPAGLNFDMLPLPSGWPTAVDYSDDVWNAVRDGTMPPGAAGHETRGDGEWVFDPQRRDDAPKLPTLGTDAGKAALRNWLACGAPVVAQTRAPDWALPPGLDAGSGPEDWTEIYAQIIEPSCAIAGCHNESGAGGLKLLDECGAYAQLLGTGACGEPRLRAGDADSLLLDKLESDKPACGQLRMPPPPFPPLAASARAAVAAWVEAGAPAEKCK